jgi:hypothetical protein
MFGPTPPSARSWISAVIDDVGAVARSLAYSRPGSLLIGYQAIGLPAYLLRLELIAQRRKPVPAIEEFVLASVSAGVDQADQISTFLGLDARLTERALVTQLGLGHLSYEVNGSTRRLSLTEPGAEALRELSFVQPERLDETVVFDRLRWRVVSGSGRALLAPRDVPWTCAKPLRSREPTLDEIELDDVASALAHRLGQREARRDPDQDVQLLSVSGMHRQSRYAVGVALTYKPSRSSDCDLVLAVDGRVDMDRTQDVTAAGARSQLGIEGAMARRKESLNTSTHGIRRTLAAEVAPDDQVDELRGKLVALQRLVGGGTPNLDGDDAEDLRSSEEIRDQIAGLERQLGDLAARRVEPWEHTWVLERALREVRGRLLVVAADAGSRTLNPQFRGLIEQACRRGVRCTIAYSRELNPPPRTETVGTALGQMAERNPRTLRIIRLEGQVPGCLVADGLWIASEFPWLAFADDVGLRAERGLAVTVREDADGAYARIVDGSTDRPPAPAAMRAPIATPLQDSFPTESKKELAVRVRDLIKAGETPKVEFKSTLLWSVQGGVKDLRLQKMVTKTIAAFLNTRGGTLLIGVMPDGTACGIEPDCDVLQQRDDTCVDAFSRSLAAITAEHLGRAIAAQIRIHYVPMGGKTVCVVDVEPGHKPIYLTADGLQELYVRSGTTSVPLQVSEIADYIRTHWR